MDLSSLLPVHKPIASAANLAIKTRFGLKDGMLNRAINANLSWRPTLLWINKSIEYIACEVADRPYPVSIRLLFADIAATGLPIRVIVAYPSPPNLSLKDYQTDITCAKRLGIGYISVTDTNSAKIEALGIPISIYLPQPDVKKFRKLLAKPIGDAYDLYINGDPRHGVQEVGQTVEAALVELGCQGRKRGKFTTGAFKPGKHYPLSKLVEELTADKVINLAILGRCRGFADDRNCMSHKPRSLKEAEKIWRKLRDCFSVGLQILEELPDEFKNKGYTFKI